MTEVNENQTTDPTPEPSGAAGGQGSPDPAAALPPKVEFREGAVYMEVGGKSVKMVKESDLIAAKQSLETKLDTQQTAHSQAIDAKELELSDLRKQNATLNAKIKEAPTAPGGGAISDEELARIKSENETVKNSLATVNNQLLELRRANIILASGGTVTQEQLADKTLEQLDSFEEALKALATTRGGPGRYAVGGGGGAAVPQTDMQRATQILATTPVRGVREPAEQK